MALPNGVLAHHLDVLRREGFVREERRGQYLRFWTAGAAPAPLPLDTGERLLAFVREHPGATATEAAKAVAASPSLVSYHLERLETAGRVARSRQGREVRVYPLER